MIFFSVFFSGTQYTGFYRLAAHSAVRGGRVEHASVCIRNACVHLRKRKQHTVQSEVEHASVRYIYIHRYMHIWVSCLVVTHCSLFSFIFLHIYIYMNIYIVEQATLGIRAASVHLVLMGRDNLATESRRSRRWRRRSLLLLLLLHLLR